MLDCPFCRHRFESSSNDNQVTCPQCGCDVEVSTKWSSIARLTNLAEAGYFEHLLRSQGIVPRIIARDDFDALRGGWQPTFVMQVRGTDADRGVAAMQQDVETAENHVSPHGDEDDDDEATSRWMPVALMLVAGGLVYWGGGGGGLAPRPPQARDRQQTLWKALTETPQPLFSPEGPRGSRRQIRYDAQSDRLYVEEDFDGDGRMDRRRAFSAGRLVEDVRL